VKIGGTPAQTNRQQENGSPPFAAKAAVTSAAEPVRTGDLPYRRLLEALGVAVYATDAAGRIVFFNDAAAELWGRRPELGKDEWCGSYRILHPDGTHMPHDQCPMAICLKENRAVRGMEAIAERPDGSHFWFMPFPTPIRDDAGRLVGAINVLIDVTDRKRAEVDAFRFAGIVESSDDAIVSKDVNGIIGSWNPAAERIFGYTADEVIGRSVRLIIPPDRQNEEDEVLRRIKIGERVDHFETLRRRKDGTDVPISLTVSPVKDETGCIIGASKIARDITVQKRAEEALHKSIAVKDEFLSLVSHELKTPIATILGNALVLLRRGDTLPAADKEQALRDVADEADKLQRIIENLLLLTRLDAGQELDTEPVRVPALVAQAIAGFQHRNVKRPISMLEEGGVPIALGQPAMLLLVIENMISNADKYSPSGAPIECVVRENSEGEIDVSVRDYGIGLDTAEAEELFTPFYRSPKARAKAKGMGLGLAVCKRLVEAQGGRIWACARPEGGCDFTFTLRRAEEDWE